MKLFLSLVLLSVLSNPAFAERGKCKRILKKGQKLGIKGNDFAEKARVRWIKGQDEVRAHNFDKACSIAVNTLELYNDASTYYTKAMDKFNEADYTVCNNIQSIRNSRIHHDRVMEANFGIEYYLDEDYSVLSYFNNNCE
ncbi:hypothetical protein A9Q84_13760 [Halobacteriovorax marinus]|uniref:Uncharacterized protein n=1 Tax=Halobacteriovorax marinus TaxID=97084 RepID=A0A1Y5F8X9_9BACT|nr:hypothetical protein A9Q84_13760 [Halobacteriovorax marinus]